MPNRTTATAEDRREAIFALEIAIGKAERGARRVRREGNLEAERRFLARAASLRRVADDLAKGEG